jgi:hypothetical protein
VKESVKRRGLRYLNDGVRGKVSDTNDPGVLLAGEHETRIASLLSSDTSANNKEKKYHKKRPVAAYPLEDVFVAHVGSVLELVQVVEDHAAWGAEVGLVEIDERVKGWLRGWGGGPTYCPCAGCSAGRWGAR